MIIEVRLEGHLERFRPDGQRQFTVPLAQRATVRDLIEASGVPWAEVGVAAVNGVHADDGQVLADGDRVILLAPIQGG